MAFQESFSLHSSLEDKRVNEKENRQHITRLKHKICCPEIVSAFQKTYWCLCWNGKQLTFRSCQWERFFFTDYQEPFNEEAVFTSKWVNNVCVKETRLLPLELKLGQICLLFSRQQHTSHQFTMKYSPQLSLITFLGMRSKPNANSPVHKSFMIWWTTPSLPCEVASTGDDGDMIVNQEGSAYNTVKALNGKISHLGTINPSTAKILNSWAPCFRCVGFVGSPSALTSFPMHI